MSDESLIDESESDPVDPKEYEFSEEKYLAQLKTFGMTKADVQDIESDDYKVKSEEKNQLLVYIRNYDNDGNLIDSPANAVKTCVDTFEKSIEILTWFTKEKKNKEDGSVYYEKVAHKEIRDVSDDSIYAEEEVLKVKPHIIDSTRFFDVFLKSYFEKYQSNPISTGKTLYIEFHNTTDNYKYYEITNEDLIYFKNSNYNIIGLNLDNRNFIVDSDKLFEITSLTLENLNIIFKTENGFSIKATDLYMDTIKITSSFKDRLSQFALTISEYAKLSYITFTDDICEFDFLNPIESNMQKWMKTNIEIFGFDYINENKEYNYKIENIFKFSSFYSVKINSVNISLKNANIGIFKFNNIMDLNLSSINVYSVNGFGKNIISLTKVTNFSGCGIYGNQDKRDKDIYLIHTNQGGMMGEYKCTSVIATNIGLLSCMTESILLISLSNSKCINFYKPIQYIDSCVNKIVFSNCYFDMIEEFIIGTPKVSIFDSKFTNIQNLKFIPSEKLYISNTSLSGAQVNLEATDDASILIDDSKINFNSIDIKGDKGTGSYKHSTCRIICSKFNAQYLNKISSENSEIDVKTINILGNNITAFNPHFINSTLKEVNIGGNIKNSLLLIDSNNPIKVTYNINTCKGNFNVHYYNKLDEINLNVDTSKVKVSFDSTNDIDEETKINITCKNDCTSSVFTSYKNKLIFIPQATGSFADFKKYNSNDDLNKYEFKNKIAYGNL